PASWELLKKADRTGPARVAKHTRAGPSARRLAKHSPPGLTAAHKPRDRASRPSIEGIDVHYQDSQVLICAHVLKNCLRSHLLTPPRRHRHENSTDPRRPGPQPDDHQRIRRPEQRPLPSRG